MGGERFGLGDRVKWIMKKRQKVEGGGRADRFCNCALGGLFGIGQALAQWASCEK